MAYDFYIGDTLLPVAPGKLTVKIGNGNKTYHLINQGEINVLKAPGLTEIEFECLLPNTKYPFASYKNGFQGADFYLGKLEELKTQKQAFQFIVSRSQPDGNILFDTNITCSLEEYSIVEDAGEHGTDVMVSVSLKQYRSYGVKKCKVKVGKKLRVGKLRKTKGIHISVFEGNVALLSDGCYQIKITKAVTLYNLAKKIYGDGELYELIAKANSTGIRADGTSVVLWKKSTRLKKGTDVLVPPNYYS